MHDIFCPGIFDKRIASKHKLRRSIIPAAHRGRHQNLCHHRIGFLCIIICFHDIGIFIIVNLILRDLFSTLCVKVFPTVYVPECHLIAHPGPVTVINFFVIIILLIDCRNGILLIQSCDIAFEHLYFLKRECIHSIQLNIVIITAIICLFLPIEITLFLLFCHGMSHGCKIRQHIFFLYFFQNPGCLSVDTSTLFDAILREHGLHCRIFHRFIGRMKSFLHVKIIRIGKHKIAHTEVFQIQIHIKSVCKHNGQI